MATDFRRNNLKNDLEGSIEYLANAEAQYPSNKAYFVENRKKLQDILNAIMDESKPMSDSVYNNAYDTLRQVKEAQIKFEYQKDKGKVVVYAVMFVVGALGLYYWNKNRKK